MLRARRNRFVNDAVPDPQPAKIEPLDPLDQPGLLQFRQVNDQRLKSRLDFSSQIPDAILATLLVAFQEVRCQEGLPEIDECVAAISLFRGISQTDGNNPQTQLASMPML